MFVLAVVLILNSTASVYLFRYLPVNEEEHGQYLYENPALVQGVQIDRQTLTK